SANAAGTADPINNPTLRSDSDAGWGQQNQLNSSPNGRPPFVPPTVPPPKNKFEKLEIANSLIKIKKLVPSCLLVVSQLLFYSVRCGRHWEGLGESAKLVKETTKKIYGVWRIMRNFAVGKRGEPINNQRR
ncbi:MAG: hypothetical protein IJ835_04550, partial [Muribaculaceae bacterium]|nr:hypothetical protein [Muribaculaceae bacterium]